MRPAAPVPLHPHMLTHESLQVLDLKLQVARVQGLPESSSLILELQLKPAQARDREAKGKKSSLRQLTVGHVA